MAAATAASLFSARLANRTVGLATGVSLTAMGVLLIVLLGVSAGLLL